MNSFCTGIRIGAKPLTCNERILSPPPPPPHPSPLPIGWGEGGSSAVVGLPLAPAEGERAGVRGTGGTVWMRPPATVSLPRYLSS